MAENFNPQELKNKILKLECLRLGSNFEGVCQYNGFTIFVNLALPGEIIEARVERVEKSHAFAKLLNIIEASKDRIEAKCQYFSQCGGCSCQHMYYANTLEEKGNKVNDCLKYIAKIDCKVPNALGLDNPWNSRNKTSLPIREVDGKSLIGFYKKRSHNIIDTESCPIALHCLSDIIKTIRTWMNSYKIKAYNESTGKGSLRHIVVRNSNKGEIMIILVSNGRNLRHTSELIESLKFNISGFSSLYQNINTLRNNVILGRENILLYGKPTIKETIFDIDFEISPLSFLQVNSEQTLKLYKTAVDMAEISKNDICVDAYSGVGTISMIISKYAKKVIGIEIIEEAVANAKENAIKNKINNAEFILGDVECELPKLLEKGICPDVLILDPPRKGVEKSVIDAIISSKPERIVYISCNPATQARDIKCFCEEAYTLKAVQPVDMFCMASEVENIALLIRR